MDNNIPMREEPAPWTAPPPKKPVWLPTNNLQWKKIPVKQLTSSINAPRVDRVLQQKWIRHDDDKMKEEWRDVPEV